MQRAPIYRTPVERVAGMAHRARALGILQQMRGNLQGLKRLGMYLISETGPDPELDRMVRQLEAKLDTMTQKAVDNK